MERLPRPDPSFEDLGDLVESMRSSTLPPPEWTAPLTSVVPPPVEAPAALGRKQRKRGEEAVLRAKVNACWRRADPKAQRASFIELARWLSGHERELDTAAALLEAALAIESSEPSEPLRRELAAMFESLGEHARAATVLGPLATDASLSADARDQIAQRVQLLNIRAGAAPSISSTWIARLGEPFLDAAAWRDALATVLFEPLSLADLAPSFSASLRGLAQVDPASAAAVARRTLDVLGAQNELVRQSLLDCADRVSDGRFAVSVLERWASAERSADRRRDALVSLAHRYAWLGDADAEAWVLVRALSEGALPGNLRERIDALMARSLSADGEIALTSLRAEWAVASGAPADECARLFRELGAALWDSGTDQEGAVRAWIRAARLIPERGYATLGVDLFHFGDPRFALEQLAAIAVSEADPRNAALAALEAARAAMSVGEPQRAFELAGLALSKVPGHAEALELAEIAADQGRQFDELSTLYFRIADASLGRFGRRAAHFRAAKRFEVAGRPELSLKHAAESFLAVPTEGTSLSMLARAAARAGRPSQAVVTVEQVAEATTNPAARAAWLIRATGLVGQDDDGDRQRVDLLLRATRALPELATIARLQDAAAAWLRKVPEEREALELRLARVSQALAKELEGPSGACVAIAFAKLMLRLFDGSPTALSVVELALGMDADIDEYAELRPFVPELAGSGGAAEFVARTAALAASPHSNFGAPALALLRLIAERLGLSTIATPLLIREATRNPDDDEVVVAAHRAALASGPPLVSEPVRAAMGRRVSSERLAEALTAVGNARAVSGDLAEAVQLFELASPLLAGDARCQLERTLIPLYRDLHREDAAESRLSALAQNASEPPQTRAEYLDMLGELLERKGDVIGAATSCHAALLAAPSPLRANALVRLLPRVSDVAMRAESLRIVGALSSGEFRRKLALERIDLLEHELRDGEEASVALAELIAENPQDAALLVRMGDISAGLGRVGEAERVWRRAVQLTTDAVQLRAIDERLMALATKASPRSSGRLRARAAVSEAPPPVGRPTPAPPIEDDSRFWDGLAKGDAAAGDELVRRAEESRTDSRELFLRVRRAQADLLPGDEQRLHQLHAAALAEGDLKQARAVEHVLRAIRRDERPLAAPSLYGQTRQPGTLSLLLAPSAGGWSDALTLVWEGASVLFTRDAASYGITPADRSAAGALLSATRIVEGAMRLLDIPQVSLFAPRSQGVPGVVPAVFSPPGLILSGDCREDSAPLKLVMGKGLSASLPQHLLLLGLPAPEGRAVFHALLGAFGPPELGRTLDVYASKLAEGFWSLLPPRTQRRLSEILRNEGTADYDHLVERARQSGRRLGLFLSGDFASTARALLAETGLRNELSQLPGGFRQTCVSMPALADLVRLAVSASYAAARWDDRGSIPPPGQGGGRVSRF